MEHAADIDDAALQRLIPLFYARVRADAFCHHMVRALVGASLAVGEGRRDPTWLAELVVAERGAMTEALAPPHGLTLEAVANPPAAELAARATHTRARPQSR